jgi:hypothetical protein
VSVYQSDVFAAIPASEQWDLVVSNPPHFDAAQTGPWGLRAFDPGWQIHRRFYAGVRSHLKPHGQCLLLENYHGSTEATFAPMLNGAGLEYAGSFMVNEHVPYPMGALELPPLNAFYFFWTRVQHEARVWRSAAPAREIALMLDRSGAVRHEEGADRPLRLPIGEKYAVVVSSRKAGWRLSWDVLRNVVYAEPSDGRGALPRPRRVEFIPLAPSAVVDPAGRVLVEFA